jgi:hypothetical protein
MDEFTTDLFAPEDTSVESSSSNSSHVLPFTHSEKTDLDSPLGLDDHLGLESFFRDGKELGEAHCALIAQRYKFFEYSATHWAEHHSLCELDGNMDYFKTYHAHHGIVRLTIEKASGISAPRKKSRVSRLIAKVVKDVPDCYVMVNVGAEPEWRTQVQKNDHEPVWNETHDFLVSDFEQIIAVDIQDDHLVGGDDIGVGQTTIKDVLLNGGTHEMSLTHKGEPTDAKLS